VDVCCLFLHNTCRAPHNPRYVYAEEVSLTRPAKPQPPPKGVDFDSCCDCGDCCCSGGRQSSGHNDNDACCVPPDEREREALTNRKIRSMLCVLSSRTSCHPGAVCGPPMGECLKEESNEARESKWIADYRTAKQHRTDVFYASREANPERYQYHRTPSGRMEATMIRPAGEEIYDYQCCCRCVMQPPEAVEGLVMQRAEPVPQEEEACVALAAIGLADKDPDVKGLSQQAHAALEAW